VIDQSIKHQVIVDIETRDNRFHISRQRRRNIVARYYWKLGRFRTSYYCTVLAPEYAERADDRGC
jgi:hypothetical protein